MFTRSNTAPAWGPYKIFPWWIIEGSTGGEESYTRIFDSVADEIRFEGWSEDRQRVSLDQSVLTAQGNRELRAFRRAVRGMAKMFLFRDMRECWMGVPNSYGQDLEPVSWEFIGTGNGSNIDFQLRLWENVQGEEIIRPVYFPNHGYPALYNSLGELESPPQRLRVKVAGVEVFNWSVDRINSGILRFDAAPANGAKIECFGSFFVAMRCNQDTIKTKPQGGGSSFLLEGVEFIEPKSRQ